MNLLLYTHVFLWSYESPEKISSQAMSELSNSSNDLFLSLASIWEIQIKIGASKLQFQDSLKDILKNQQELNGFKILPIELSHALHLENLPLHHRDPFDRMLISQAIAENMTLVSADKRFADYDVNLLW